MKIVCVEPLGISRERFEALRAHYAETGHTMEYYMDRREDENALVERMSDADIVAISNIRLTATVLSQCTKLKYLSVAFTGLDHIDLDYCHSHGITVQNAAGYSTTAVSELAMGMMIDLLRQVTALDGTIRHGGGRGTFVGRELRGKTVGIIGTGAIGIATIHLLQAFGCRVIAYSRTVRPEVESGGVQYVGLDELLRKSDIISLHVPLSADTKHLIGAPELSQMKPTALLINTARGPVCDIKAVASALKAGTIAGAAFDVFEQEPPLFPDHALLQAPNCLCTPHIAFATEESFEARAEIVFNHINQYLS